jgi:hypothetical protein
VYLNSDNVVNSATVLVQGGTVGTTDNTPGAMDMASNGQHIILTSGSGTVMQCIEVAFAPDAGSGACCDSGGGCQALTAAVCASAAGNFLGVGAACIPDPCPQPGACCVTATSACSFTLQSACTGGSTWNGGTVCSPNPCATPAGACCTASSCAVVVQTACTGPQTHFAGANTVCNAPGNNRTPCCKADFNQSGAVTVQDIFDFLTAYFTNSPTADVNASGAVSVQDIFDYLTLYFAGCT